MSFNWILGKKAKSSSGIGQKESLIAAFLFSLRLQNLKLLEIIFSESALFFIGFALVFTFL